MLKELMKYLKSEKGRERLAGHLHRAVVWGLRTLVLLFPVFILPWAGLPLESMKAHLVVFSSLVLLTLWALSISLTSKPILRFHVLMLGMIGFLLVSALSAALSSSALTGFLGIGGREMWSVLATLGVTLTAVLIGATTRRKSDLVYLAYCAGLGLALAGILELLTLSGIFLYPFAFTHQRIWTSLGTPKVFAFLSAIGALFSLFSLRLAASKKFSFFNLTNIIAILIDFFVLLRVDFYGAWLFFAFGLILFAGTAFWSDHKILFWERYIPIALFALAIIFTMIGSPIRQNLITEYHLDPSTSWDVASEGLKGHLLLGTGPGTFEYSYSRFRPVEFNSGSRWNARFDRPGTHLLTIFATTGVLGLLFWLSPILLLGVSLGRKILHNKISDPIIFWSSVPALIIFGSFFFFGSNFALVWYLAVSLGMAAAVLGKDVELPVRGSRSFRLLSLSAFTVIFIIFVRAGVHEARALLGEFNLALGGDVGSFVRQRQDHLKAAVNLTRHEPRALRAFAKTSLQLANEESKAEKVNASRVQELLGQATAAVKEATRVDPEDVENWLALGAVYQNLLPFVEGSGEWVVRAYTEALIREPSNPLPRVEMGKSYLTLGDRMRQEGMEKDLFQHIYRNAEEELIKAIQVKADYAPAHFYLGLVYDRQGREEDAVLKLEAVERYNPSDVGVAYELGLLYLRRGKLDKAELEFTRAVNNLPAFSNARWQLANVLLRQGQKSEAIAELKKILEYNPGNPNVTRAIEEIKEGRNRL